MIPAGWLSNSSNMPAGTKAFASALKDAGMVTLALAPSLNGLQANLRAVFKTGEQAGVSRTQLSSVTDMLVKFIEREKQKPNPADLSGVLTSGVFTIDGNVVHGKWPIHRSFLESLAGGKIE
jgi:hypothetical protein